MEKKETNKAKKTKKKNENIANQNCKLRKLLVKLKKIDLLKVLSLLIILIVIVLALLGSYSNFNGKGTIPGYKFADILTPYDEYILSPSANIVETDVYVDQDGKMIRKVPAAELPDNIKLSTDNEALKKENEKLKLEPLDEEVKNFKIEKRQVADNNEEALKRESIEQSQQILINSLKANGINDFRVRKDLKHGQMIIEVPQLKEKTSILEPAKDTGKFEEKESTRIQSILGTTGSFEISDHQTGKIYIDETNVKKIETNIYEGYGIVLDIQLDQKGTEVLKDISSKYIKVERDGKQGEYKLDIKASGITLQSSSFPQIIDNGLLQLVIAKIDPKNPIKTRETYDEIKRLENAIKVGKTKTVYNVDNVYKGVTPILNKTAFISLTIISLVILLILGLVFVFKNGILGLKQLILFLGYISSVILITRFTNIIITIPALVSMFVVSILEYIVIRRYVKELKNIDLVENVSEVQIITELIKDTFILLAMSIVLSFSINIIISSFAMTLFIGIALLYLYNLIFLRKVLGK